MHISFHWHVLTSNKIINQQNVDGPTIIRTVERHNRNNDSIQIIKSKTRDNRPVSISIYVCMCARAYSSLEIHHELYGRLFAGDAFGKRFVFIVL